MEAIKNVQKRDHLKEQIKTLKKKKQQIIDEIQRLQKDLDKVNHDLGL